MIEVPNRCTGLGEYRMEAEDIREALRDLPEQAVAVWHTHPRGLVGPSRGDMQNRPPDDVPMLVVALTEDGPVPTWF